MIPGNPSTAATRTGSPYRRLAMLLLLVGLACRLALFLLNHPMYQDEAFVALNVAERDYAGLTRQLDEMQVAPILFLWMERAAYELLGPAEQALRLAPFLAGMLALGLFWHLARRVVSPPAAAIAVGFLAVSRWPLHMTCQVKPYSLDLLASVVPLVLAVHWQRQPERLRWLVLLVLVTPLAVAASFPTVFVAGGVASVLAVAAWRRADAKAGLLVAAYGAVLAGSFFYFDVILGRQQIGPPGEPLHEYMANYWANAFPPDQPLPIVKWLVRSHFGPLMGYPYGNGNTAGALAFPLVLVGIWGCWRAGRKRLLALCLIPFALSLTAAFLHKYPYGGCTRLSQHLAPGVCLLAGVGFVRIARKLSDSLTVRRRTIWAFGSVLALFGAGLVVHWSFCPYRDREDPWAKTIGLAIMDRAEPGDRVVCTGLPETVRAQILWYLRIHGGRPLRADQMNGADASVRDGSVWLFTGALANGQTPSEAGVWAPAGGGPAVKIEHRATFVVPVPQFGGATLRTDLWGVVAATASGHPRTVSGK